MFQFFANIFGYLLNLIYQIVNNYGLAMILFTLVIKLVLLPISIKQQKTMKKSQKINEEMKQIQFKYKNDPEKLNQETMSLYKRENMSPFSGCFSAIAQIILLFAVFYLVRSPLTYMRKIDSNVINTHIEQLTQAEKRTSVAYPEIDVIREINYLKEQNPDAKEIDEYALNMEFLGLDLSKIPQQNLGDWTVYIIPVLYILSSFISMKFLTATQGKKKKEENEAIEGSETNQEEVDPMEQTNKMMSWMMPIMSVSISLVAPLGLALYWLVSNVTNIIERLILNKILKEDEE